MKLAILLAMLCIPVLCYADTSKEVTQPVTVLVKHQATESVPWLSLKRRGAIWVSPSVITWDDGVTPRWKFGVGSSYALGKHSSMVMHVYRDYQDRGQKGRFRPQIAWTLNF